jgi:hypothetical protein
MCVGQIILAELLIRTVTAAVVRVCACTHWGSVRAYIDPGTGSFIIQLLIASLAGIIYLIKRFWRSIKGYPLKLLHKRKGD